MKKKSLIPEKARIVGGSGAGHRKIYISREVYKNIFNFSKDKNVVQCGGVLLGQFVAERDGDYVIIRAFVEGKYSEGTSNSITFTKDTWNYIDNKKEEYPEYDIVGWMHTNPDTGRRASDYDEFFHSHMFDNRDIVAYIVDPVQIAEAFYYWENGHLVRSDGFYIFSEAVMPKIIPERKGRMSRHHGALEDLQIVDTPNAKSLNTNVKDKSVSGVNMFETATIGVNGSEKKYETKSLEIDTEELRKVFEEAEKKVEEDKSDIEAYAFNQELGEQTVLTESANSEEVKVKPSKWSKKSEEDEYLIMDENDRIAMELEEAEEEKPKKLSRKEKKALQKAKKAEKLEKAKQKSQTPVRNIDVESVRDRVSKLAGEKIDAATNVEEFAEDTLVSENTISSERVDSEEIQTVKMDETLANKTETLVLDEIVAANTGVVEDNNVASDNSKEDNEAVVANDIHEDKAKEIESKHVIKENTKPIESIDVLEESIKENEVNDILPKSSSENESKDVVLAENVSGKKSNLPIVIAILAVVIIVLSAVVGFSFKKIIDLEKEITRLYNNDEIIAKYINSGGQEETTSTAGETAAETTSEATTQNENQDSKETESAGGENTSEAVSETQAETVNGQ